MATVAVVARPKSDGRKPLPLYLRISHQGKTSYLSLGIRIARKHWNKETRQIRKTHRDHAVLNKYIADNVAQATGIINTLIAEGRAMTPTAVITRMEKPDKMKATPPGDFFSFCDELLEQYKSRGHIATWKAYKTAVTKLRTWHKDKTDSSVLAFKEMKPRLIRDFQTYLINVKGNRVNTVTKNLSCIRTMVIRAVKEKHLRYEDNPFHAITLHNEPTTREKASTDEIRKLRNLVLKKDSLIWHVQQWWLFAFYAGGMRISDLCTFRREHLSVSTNADGEQEVRSNYRMKKTRGVHGVLLISEAVQILDYYNWQSKSGGDRIFPILDGYDISSPLKLHNSISTRTTLINKYLKKIQKRAEIDTALTTHLSRHSVAGYLLEQGYDVYTIKEVLGHENVRVTENYLKGFTGNQTDEALRSLKL